MIQKLLVAMNPSSASFMSPSTCRCPPTRVPAFATPCMLCLPDADLLMMNDHASKRSMTLCTRLAISPPQRRSDTDRTPQHELEPETTTSVSYDVLGACARGTLASPIIAGSLQYSREMKYLWAGAVLLIRGMVEVRECTQCMSSGEASGLADASSRGSNTACMHMKTRTERPSARRSQTLNILDQPTLNPDN